VKPLIQPSADGILYVWVDLGVGVELTRLRETESGAVKGWINVESVRPEASGHIWWAQVTLTTATDRRTLVGKLEKFSPREPGSWELDVDRCFQHAVQHFLEVPPAVSLAEVAAPLETQMLFDPVLPYGLVCLLLADQGSTKSFLMLYLAACLVLGRESVFGPPALQAPAVFFDWEVDERVARRRLEWICRGFGCEIPRHLYYVNMSERGRLADRIRDMRQQISRLGAQLAIVDSLTFATGGDLNTTEMSAPTMSAIGSLGDGVTKLVSAHPNKASRGASASDISVIGSGLFEFRARAIWLLQREHEAGSRFVVSMTSRKPFDGPPPKPQAYRLVFDNTARAVRFEHADITESAELTERGLTLAERIRLALRKRDENTRTLAEDLGTTTNTVRTTIGRMRDVISLSGETSGGAGNTTVWSLRDEINGQ